MTARAARRLGSVAESLLIRPELSTFRQRAVLVTGLASATVLAVAAWQPFADPGASAQLEQARLASEAAEGIAAEWDLWMRAPELPVPDAIAAVVPSAVRDEPAMASAQVESDRGAARALLSESERVELSRNDLPEALALVEEALTKHPTPTEVARGRLRGVQIAARLGRRDDVRRHFDASIGVLARPTAVPPAAEDRAPDGAEVSVARPEATAPLDGTELVDGASALALAVLAAGDAIDDGQRAPACARLAALAESGALVLPGADPELARAGDRYVVTVDPRRAAFEDLLAARCPALRADPAASALRSVARPLLGALRTDVWTVRRAADGIAFARAADGEHARVALATFEQVERRLTELAAHRGLLATGIAIDARGTREDLGPALRSPIELAAGAVSITLRHPHPESIATGARRRAAWLRTGMLALAAAIAAAAVFAHRALARERRLADLRSRFVANVSHELRTPIASILLLAENLESGRAGPGSAPRYHAAIRGEALRLRRLVEDVLDFSRVERGRRIAIERAETDLDAWAAALEVDLRELATRHGLELSFESTPPLGRAAVDGEALRRAALNLVDNAAKHSGARDVAVALRATDADFVLTVRDRGRGIPAARRNEVFEPFARLDEDRGAPGAGLGLAIVREIAQAHGGTARAVDPVSGPGAQFDVQIPRDGTEVPA